MPARSGRRAPLGCPWLPELAGGYLPQFCCRPRRRRDLWGYCFQQQQGRGRVGFFVGFLTAEPPWTPGPFAAHFQPPECAVFAFVEPGGGRLHQRLVRAPGSLFRLSYDLLTKYTARRPRWEFQEEQGAALLRRVPLAAFPRREREKYARNFFMETLALLQRSRLPDKLAGLAESR